MSTDFPFVEVSKNLQRYVGKVKKGKHEYEAEGDEDKYRDWVEVLVEQKELPLVTFTWAPIYVGVSREAVYKRCREGKLTIFYFYINQSVPLLKRFKYVKSSYAFLSLSELKAWREI